MTTKDGQWVLAMKVSSDVSGEGSLPTAGADFIIMSSANSESGVGAVSLMED